MKYSEVLGRATWNFLHTMAAGYENNGNPRLENDVKRMMHYMSRTYPCSKCAPHFRSYIKKNPVTAKTGRDFKIYMCNFHNSVNKRLGKNIYTCK